MADEPVNAPQPATPPAAVVETPAPETPAVVEQPEPVDFTGQSDDEVAAVAEAAHAEGTEILDGPAEEFTEEREAVMAAAFARRDAANSELTARAERMSRLAAERERNSNFAAVKVNRPAAPAAPSVPRVADIVKPEVPQVPQAAAPRAFKLIVPTDAHNLVNDRPQGSEFANIGEVAVAFEKRIPSYGSTGNARSVSHGVAMIQRDYGKALTVTGENSDDDVIRFARREGNLHGGNVVKAWSKKVEETGSLTAAAGWCAPSETLYDLCEMETTAGMLEVPEVVATRGGFRYTSDISYPDLFAATSYTGLTEAQVIAGTPEKNCAPIPCPTFEEARLGVSATCLTGSFLQLRGYPEMVARYVRGALVAHDHKQNAAKIAAIVARAGTVTPIAAPTSDAAVSAVLKAVEVAANDIRYRYQLARNASLEVVFPEWIIPVLRDDFTRRSFPGDPAVTDAQIMSWFAVRNVRPQFVRDWQDGYFPGAGTAATLPGGDATAPFAAEIVPQATAVQFLIYPAGSIVMAVQDVVTLRNVYDSTSLKANQYTELFTEDGWAPIFPCPGLRLYSALTCRSGATGEQIAWGCNLPTP